MGQHGFTIQQIIERKPLISKLTPVRFNGIKIQPCGKVRKKIECKCDCGNITIIMIGAFLNGSTRSCGCICKETRHRKYSQYIKKLSASYRAMISRCYNPKDIGYKNYGGNGVIVCDEWKFDYQKFLDWSLENGWKEGLQLDKDILGDGKLYSPKTCKWITPFENMCHRSISRKYNYNGEILTLVQISRIENVDYDKLRKRMRYKTMDQSLMELKG